MENNPRSILILRFSSIGDIVHSTSVIGTLKSYFPDSSIDFMTLSKFAPLVQNHPKINKVFLVDINDGYFALRKIGLSMGKKSYDLFSKDRFAWVVDNEDEKKLITTMKKASRLMIVGNSESGTQTTDHYSMMGFTKAYNTAKKNCS